MSISRFISIALLASILALCFCPHSVESRSVPAYPTRGPSAHYIKRGDSFTGEANRFEGEISGSCGSTETDDSLSVALNAAQYGAMGQKSQHCGRSVRITHGDQSVDAVVADCCPDCDFGDLDVTEAVYQALGGSGDMVALDIRWQFI
jgi:expansin (peptidoglycan-binding protein)